jgi:hypothetical protein
MRMSEHGCGCNDCNRRDFLAAAGLTAGLMALHSLPAEAGEAGGARPRLKQGATVRAVFLYPPSETFSDDPDGWWSWPGNEFDAEGRQKRYTDALHKIATKFGMTINITDEPIGTDQQVQNLARQLRAEKLDGLLLTMFYNRSLGHADVLLKAAEEAGLPVIFYVGLGVKHGSIRQYRRDGIYFIQSLDNFDAIEYGLRMIQAKKRMSQTRLLSVTEAEETREGVEKFLGTVVRVVPFAQYADAFGKVSINRKVRDWIGRIKGKATEIRGVTDQAMENTARAHFALLHLLDRHQADGLTMNCLQRGMLKPCISFSQLNSQLVPATCENDFPALYTQLLGQQLLGRPGFQHNPCFETERNHYYASHCTCAPHLHGPDRPEEPYLLRRFAHTNEGSCAIQVFWKPQEPVTMVRYYPGEPPTLDVYSGKVVASHPMPPAAGCTTNVEIEITDRPDACMVQGHHNLLFCGDDARRFRLFARLYKMRLADPI